MRFLKTVVLLIPFFSFAQRENLQLKPVEIANAEKGFKVIQGKMDSLNLGFIEHVNILHMGDSHIQPDNFSGITRKFLQQKYGNAGRGLVFPYSVAKTNGPKDFTASSSSIWSSSWIIHYPHKFKMGLPGISIKSELDKGDLNISLKKDSISNPYTSGFILYSMLDAKAGKIAVNGKFEKKFSNPDFDTLRFSTEIPSDKLNVSFSGSPVVIEGIYFENVAPGIVYNSAGVAGARFQDYMANDLFLKQLPYFDLDLLIVSLGTNEAFDPKFSKEKFEAMVDSTFNKISAMIPNTSVLITLPSENYRVSKAGVNENARIPIIAEILKEKCLKYNFAYWDLFEAMGGKGSMLTWKKNNLVNKDYIHFLRKGYNLQGELLFEALDRSFR